MKTVDVVSVQNMRESDAATIAGGVLGYELMGRAARGIFDSHDWRGLTTIVAGSGNNGGDGYALACLLAEAGLECQIVRTSEKVSDDGGRYLEKAMELGVAVSKFDPDGQQLDNSQTLVDCILGTGFKGTPREDVSIVIDRINSSGAFVVSADINSGLNGDTGTAVKAVQSQLTVSIGYIKHGLLKADTAGFAKRVVNIDIGIELVQQEDLLVCKEDFDRLMADGASAQHDGPAARFIEQDGRKIYEQPYWVDIDWNRIR